MYSPASLSRTSSTTSVSSSDDAGGSSGGNIPRRTRKRFTSTQLTMLENLFHQNSHPPREDREALAKLGGMEPKSVTIWFQNKRQTERKGALNNATNTARCYPSSLITHNYCTSSRPSLDCVASRSELRMPPPRTPTRRSNPDANIWDNMPSSPIAPPLSPPSHQYIQLGKMQHSKRTLEWACAAARLSDKTSVGSSRNRREQRGRADWTEDDTDEAVTPPSTLAGGDIRWSIEPGGRMTVHKELHDDDMMKAALTLCGLGKR